MIRQDGIATLAAIGIILFSSAVGMITEHFIEKDDSKLRCIKDCVLKKEKNK